MIIFLYFWRVRIHSGVYWRCVMIQWLFWSCYRTSPTCVLAVSEYSGAVLIFRPMITTTRMAEEARRSPSPPPGARALSLFMAMLFLASLSNSQHSDSVTFCHFTCFILCLIPELNTTLFPHQFDQSLLHVRSSYRCSSSSPSSSSLASLLPTEFSPFLHKQGN